MWPVFARSNVTGIESEADALRRRTSRGVDLRADHATACARYESPAFLPEPVADVNDTFAFATETLAALSTYAHLQSGDGSSVAKTSRFRARPRATSCCHASCETGREVLRAVRPGCAALCRCMGRQFRADTGWFAGHRGVTEGGWPCVIRDLSWGQRHCVCHARGRHRARRHRRPHPRANGSVRVRTSPRRGKKLKSHVRPAATGRNICRTAEPFAPIP